MNELRRIAVLAPCEGLADFPTYFRGADAASFLAAWRAAWRPGLIATAGRPPEVLCSYHLPDSTHLHDPTESDGHLATKRCEHALVLAPGPAVEDGVQLWIDEARQQLGDRIAVVDSFASTAEVISGIERSPAGAFLGAETPYDQDVAALGYALMQVLSMTGGEGEPEWFDRPAFDQHAVDAAKAAAAGEERALHQALRGAYDQLETLRNHTYPTDPWLLDTVLVAETTLGDRLSRELEDPTPKTLRLTKPLAEAIGAAEGASSSLRNAVQAGRLSLAVGDRGHASEPDTWSGAPPESLADAIDGASDAIHRLTGASAVVAAPWSAALPPRLTQVLAQRGFAGLIGGGFDGDDPPYCEHAKASVRTPEGRLMPAVVRRPIDLGAPETFLKWGELLVGALQTDPVATMPLAGWAGCRSEFLELLRAVARRSPVLGVFATAEHYFAESAPADRDATPTADQYAPSTRQSLSGPEGGADLATRYLMPGLAEIAGATGVGDPADRCAALVGAASTPSNNDPPGGGSMAIHPWSFSADHVCRDTGVRYRLPPCGFALGEEVRAVSVPRADGLTLRNEHARLEVDRASGGVRGLRLPGQRGPFLSQRIAAGHARNRAGWIAMEADQPGDPVSTPAAGQIATGGVLHDRRGGAIARFRQTLILAADEQRLEAVVELEPLAAAAEHRWFAWRLRLRDADWHAYRGVQWKRLPHAGTRTVATDYYEMVAGPRRISLVADSPLRVTRQDGRTVDLLLADGLTEPVVHRLLVGFGDERPLTHTLMHNTRPARFSRRAGVDGPGSGWWLHVDTPNVVVSRIAPLGEEEGRRSARVHLIETSGRPTSLALRLWRPIKSIAPLDTPAAAGAGEPDTPRLDDDGVGRLTLPGHGWLRVRVSW